MEIKKLTVNGTTYQYDISSGDVILVQVTDPDGQQKTIEILRASWNGSKRELLFYTSEKVYKASIRGDAVTLLHTPCTYAVAPVGNKKQTSKSQSVLPATKSSIDEPATSETVFKSPLAGRVTKVLIGPGDQVKQGQPLVIIESMKMENELCAARPAFIKTIFIGEGNVVQQNHVLLEFEDKRGEEHAGKQSSHEQEAVSHRGLG